MNKQKLNSSRPQDDLDPRYAEEQERRRRMLQEYRRQKEAAREKKELEEKAYLQPFVVPAKVDRSSRSSTSALGTSAQNSDFGISVQETRHALERSYDPPLYNPIPHPKRKSVDQGPLTVADLSSSRNSRASQISSERERSTSSKLSGKPARISSSLAPSVLAERTNIGLDTVLADLDPVASPFRSRHIVGPPGVEDQNRSLTKSTSRMSAAASPLLSSRAQRVPRDEASIFSASLLSDQRHPSLATPQHPRAAEFSYSSAAPDQPVTEHALTPSRSLSKPQRVLVPDFSTGNDEPPTTPVHVFPRHLVTPVAATRSPSLGPALRVVTPVAAPAQPALGLDPVESQVLVEDMNTRLGLSKRRSQGRLQRTPSAREASAAAMIEIMGERVEGAGRMSRDGRKMEIETRSQTPIRLTDHNTSIARTSTELAQEPLTLAEIDNARLLRLRDPSLSLDRRAQTDNFATPLLLSRGVMDTASITMTPSSGRPMSSKRASVVRPRFKVPRPIVLQVIDSMTGRLVSEEVVPAPHLALFRLKDVMAAALIRDEPLVRALFTIISAPCPQNHHQCLSRVHARAQYWLARASFEESCGKQHEVAKLFEEALRVGAEPLEEIQAGFDMWMVRRGRLGFADDKIQENTQANHSPKRAFSPHTSGQAMSHYLVRSATTDDDVDDLSDADSPTPSILSRVSGLALELNQGPDSDEEIMHPVVRAAMRGEDDDTVEMQMPVLKSEAMLDGWRDPAPVTPMRRAGRVRVGGIVEEMRKVELESKRTTESGIKEEESASVTVLAAVKAGRREREIFGVDSVITPVRRSIRHLADLEEIGSESERRVAELLEESGFAFVPNPGVKLESAKLPASMPSTPSRRMTFTPVAEDNIFYSPALTTPLDWYHPTTTTPRTPGTLGKPLRLPLSEASAVDFSFGHNPDQEPATAPGSTVKYAAITPSRKLRDRLQTEVAISPVRRSTRIAGCSDRLPASLKEQRGELMDSLEEVRVDEFAYVPNKAVEGLRDGEAKVEVEKRKRKGVKKA